MGNYPKENYVFECPLGCKGQGDRPIAATIKGWKKHMTGQHGGWDETQLAAVVGAKPEATTTTEKPGGREQFLAEADDTEGKEPALFMGSEGVTDKPAPDEARQVKIKTGEMGKRLNVKLNKMKKKVAEALPKAVQGVVQEKGSEWWLSKSDSELLAESVEDAFEVLEVDFKIAPLSIALSNPLWVLLLPGLALLLVFLPKSMLAAKLATEREREKTDDSIPTGSDPSAPAA